MGRFKSITSRRVEVALWIEDDLFYERHVKKTNLANYKMTHCVAYYSNYYMKAKDEPDRLFQFYHLRLYRSNRSIKYKSSDQ